MEIAIKLWARHLQGVEDEYVNRAMETCVDKFAWAPDVAEFKQLAMSLKGSSKTPWVEEVLKFEKPKNEPRSNYEVKQIIDIGADICKKIKETYPELTWMKVSEKFTNLKKITKAFYPNMEDVQFLKEISKYGKNEILEAFDLEKA